MPRSPDATPHARLAREAGWYAVLRVPKSASDESLAVALLERSSVLVHPGAFYNFPSEGFLVLSLMRTHIRIRARSALAERFS